MTWKQWLTNLLRRVLGGAATSVATGPITGGNAIDGAITGAIGHVVTEPMPIFNDFFSRYEGHFGPLNPSQRSGLQFLLEKLKADPDMEDVRHHAYLLATVKHECADTWQPVEERGKGAGRAYGIPVGGHIYYGRGFVQLTWAENYRKLGDLIGEDLIGEPWRALEPNTAYRILSLGMVGGLFVAGQRLSRHINSGGCDYVSARKIVNGTDKAELIADYSVKLEGCLR